MVKLVGGVAQKATKSQDFVQCDVRVMLYLVKFVTILNYRQLDIVVHWKNYIVVKGRLFGRTMESPAVK